MGAREAAARWSVLVSEGEVIAYWKPILRGIVFGVPILLYLANALTVRLQFRVLAWLSVALTALVRVWVETAHALPQLDRALGRTGSEDPDGAILGAMIGAPILGVIGTLPVAVVHLLRKWLATRRKARDERAVTTP